MLSPALSVEETGIDGLSPDTTGGRTIYCASYMWTSELEMRRKKTSGDRRKTSYCYSIASVIHQDTLKALGSKQEIELHVPATVEHHTNDESGQRSWSFSCFVEVTLIQYATVAGHFPGVNASSVKPNPRRLIRLR